MAYNTELLSGLQGSATGPFSINPNLIDNQDFSLLKCKINSPTAQPVTSLSDTLNVIVCLDEGDADIFRIKVFGGGMNQFFNINGDFFDINIINDTINLDYIEVWSLFNNSLEAHPFHIHDVQFCVLDIEGTPLVPQLSVWKDIVLVEPFQTVRFITKFESFTDSVVPYMYHCHVLLHEDKGLMGQFIGR